VLANRPVLDLYRIVEQSISDSLPVVVVGIKCVFHFDHALRELNLANYFST
jgi:hypothetical protein